MKNVVADAMKCSSREIQIWTSNSSPINPSNIPTKPTALLTKVIYSDRNPLDHHNLNMKPDVTPTRAWMMDNDNWPKTERIFASKYLADEKLSYFTSTPSMLVRNYRKAKTCPATNFSAQRVLVSCHSKERWCLGCNNSVECEFYSSNIFGLCLCLCLCIQIQM